MDNFKTESGLIYMSGGRSYGEILIDGSVITPLTVKKERPHILLKMSRLFALTGLVILFLLNYPLINKYLLSERKNDSNIEISALPTPEERQYIPKYDPSLPQNNFLIIPSVKIETPINESIPELYENALRKGIWRVSDFGDPDSYEIPTILVAHRFGYLSWSVPYRLKNSFFNLPKTKIGDSIEIVWMQRKYVYVIYALEEGEEITDYSADLILYTCKTMNSKEKIFRYAKLLEI